MATLSAMEAVEQLEQAIKRLAPKSRPQILPKELGYGLEGLLSLCKSPEDKLALQQLVQTQRKEADHQNQKCFFQGEFDWKAAPPCFNVQRIVWLNEQEDKIHQLPRFLELQLDHPDEAKEIVQCFMEQNAMTADQMQIAHEVFTMAFTLQTLIRAFPSFPIAIQGEMLASMTDDQLMKLLDKLVVNKRTPKAKVKTRTTKAAAANAHASKNKSGTKSKSKKRKNASS